MAAMYDSQMDPAVLLQRVLDYAIRCVPALLFGWLVRSGPSSVQPKL